MLFFPSTSQYSLNSKYLVEAVLNVTQVGFGLDQLFCCFLFRKFRSLQMKIIHLLQIRKMIRIQSTFCSFQLGGQLKTDPRPLLHHTQLYRPHNRFIGHNYVQLCTGLTLDNISFRIMLVANSPGQVNNNCCCQA